MEEIKKAVLVVSFGTSHLDTLAKTIEAVEREIQEAFPEYPVYRAFTSQMIIRKLKRENGIEVFDVEGALAQMQADGIQEVTVQPTHVISGIEYEKMMEALSGASGKFRAIRTGKPLLGSTDDYKKAVQALMEEVKLQPDEMLVLMGHGTEHPANSAYPALEYTFGLLGYPQVLVGTVEGFPGLEDVLAKLEIAGRKKVLLMPFMVVAGDHAKNDMAGEEDSWKTRLTEAGYEVRAEVKGLGEIQAVRNIFVEHIREVM